MRQKLAPSGSGRFVRRLALTAALAATGYVGVGLTPGAVPPVALASEAPPPPAPPPAAGEHSHIALRARMSPSSPVMAQHLNSTAVPLGGNTWTQPADAAQLLAGSVRIKTPAKCTGSIGNALTLSVDDAALTFAAASHEPASTSLTVPFVVGTLSEPGQDTNHTLTAKFGSSCALVGEDFTIEDVKVYVLNFPYADGAGPASPPPAVPPAVDPASPTTSPAPGTGPGGGGDEAGVSPTGPSRSGYWLLGADGAVFSFGDAAPHGDASAALSAANPGAGSAAGPLRAVDIEPTPSGRGYWVLDSGGGVHPFGDASHLGDVVLAQLAAGEGPASLSSTPTGAGYWVFTNRGRTLTFGDAAFLGDVSATPLNGPVLDSVATPSGRGYYMVASDGGIFAFGDATFTGSMGGQRLNAPVRSLVPDGDGAGYWLVASDGGVFAFDAPFRGSLGDVKLNKPVVGMVRYGDGYLMVGADGGIFAFSDRPFSGSLGARPPASPIVSVAALG